MNDFVIYILIILLFNLLHCVRFKKKKHPDINLCRYMNYLAMRPNYMKHIDRENNSDNYSDRYYN